WDMRVAELTGGAGVDQIVELTGQLERSLRCLRLGGVISQIGYMASLRLEADIFSLLLASGRVHGIVGGSREMHEELFRAVGLHRLRPVIDRTFSFDEVPQALEYMAGGEHSGKIVIRF